MLALRGKKMSEKNRFKFRVWDNNFKKYRNGLAIQNSHVCTYDDNACILEQCTGLKDKNGKLIYEGDIVKEWFGETGTYQVIYENSTASFIFSNLDDEDYDYDLRYNPDLFPNQDLEVIGNIHEDEELLQCEKNS